MGWTEGGPPIAQLGQCLALEAWTHWDALDERVVSIAKMQLRCQHVVVTIDLRPFARDQLTLVEPWFKDPETQRWLGGPEWPKMALKLADGPLGEFRGMQETGRYRFLASDDDVPVGYIDIGTYDRWATWEGGTDGRGVVDIIDEPSGAMAYVVDPAQRRKGYGAKMTLALMQIPDLSHVQLFAAGIEPENTASVRCLLSAGFEPLDPTPDWEGIVYYAKSKA
jgi:RimJ/RimL family protein N-acetyltransferase